MKAASMEVFHVELSYFRIRPVRVIDYKNTDDWDIVVDENE